MVRLDTQRKRRWFDEGAQMLRAVLAHRGAQAHLLTDQDVYACPCCLSLYLHDAVAAGLLTLEHAPPKALGGRGLLLTCEECNSRSGRYFDSNALQRSIADAFQNRRVNGRLMKATAYTDDIPLRGTVQWLDGAVEFIGVPEQNDPKVQDAHVRAMDNYLDQGTIGPNTKILVSGRYNDALAQISWIRAAYLAAFAAFGWTYILNPVMNRFRAQFKQTDKRLLATLVRRNSEATPTERRILLVDDPDELRCIIVTMGEHTVFLPALDRPLECEALADSMADQLGPGEATSIDLHGKVVPWPRWPTYDLDKWEVKER